MKQVVLILLMTLTFISCEKTEIIEFSLQTPEGLVHWDILEVKGANIVDVNQKLIIDVYCPRSSSCDYVGILLSDRYDNKILIKAFGKTQTDMPCLWYAVPQKIQYKFTPDMNDTFVLEFIKKDNTVIKHYVTAK